MGGGREGIREDRLSGGGEGQVRDQDNTPDLVTVDPSSPSGCRPLSSRKVGSLSPVEVRGVEMVT